ncbi:MAG: DinB family protein [Pseudomonadaceae bacterium]|nr:DinB family protein [Pseudomonadaceae bacterium]
MINKLLGYKAWANRELFDCLLALPAGIAAEPRHTMIRLLNHVYVVDQIFRAHLSATEHGHRALNTLATPSLNELWAAVQEMDQWYLDYASGLTGEQLEQRLDFVFVDGAAGNLSRAEMLLHVVNHGTYHRGAVGELLHQCNSTPPRDVLTRYW